LQVNRIPRNSLRIGVDLYRGQVWLPVAVKIANRKMRRCQSGTSGGLRRTEETQIVCRRGFRRSPKKRQTEWETYPHQPFRDDSWVHKIGNNCIAKPGRIAKAGKAHPGYISK
jgi:hypothetical protein